jgi:hypothetical protein
MNDETMSNPLANGATEERLLAGTGGSQALLYDELYPKQYRADIFARIDSYWNDSYGSPLAVDSNAKFVVFGLPKSGNTLLVSLLSGCLDLEIIDPIRDIGKRGTGMTHRPFSPIISERTDFTQGVVLVRDLRDLAASFFEYAKTPYFRSARPEFDYTDVDSFYYDWFLSRIDHTLHVGTYVDEYATAGVPVVRFENLISNPEMEITRLLKRVGLKVDVEKIKNVVYERSFEKLKSEGLSFGELHVPPTHFSAGKKSRFSNVLTKSVIDDIERRYQDFFHRWGY